MYILLTFITLLYQLIQGAEVVYNLTITLEKAKPNCFGTPQVLINGISPGPVIRATEGDLLIINIDNQLPKDEFTMHYHGLHQKGTPFYDGVPFISQIPIPPKKSYQHRINLKGQSGSFLYHSHTKTHAITALGALIVDPKEKEPFNYDEEIIMLFSDNLFTGSKSIYNNSTNIKKDPFYHHNKVESTLFINGMPAQIPRSPGNDPGCRPIEFSVNPNKTYRLRLISGTTKEYISFAIAGHILEIVEVEGFYVKPVKLDKIPIHSGQRYTALIRTNNPTKLNYNIHGHELKREGGTRLVALGSLKYSAKAEIRYDNSFNLNIYMGEVQPYLKAYDKTAFQLYSEDTPFDLNWPMDFRLYGKQLKSPSNIFEPLIPEPVLEPTVDLYYRVTHEEKEDEETARWFVNGISLKLPNVNLLSEAYKNDTHKYDDTNFRMIHLEKDQVVQITIQNTVDLAGVCDNHPWHLHGHSYWDMGSGPGTYKPGSQTKLNKIPILRDTFTFDLALPQSQLTPKEDCGWHTIRFKTDNPGLWIFHCHILQHMDYGMVLYFMEGDKFLPPLPSDIDLF